MFEQILHLTAITFTFVAICVSLFIAKKNSKNLKD
jgi:hypothetical protein